MFKTAEIDRFERFACPRPAGGAKAALWLTLGIHALILCGLAAIGIYLAPPTVEPADLETTFSPAPPRPIDLSHVESVARQKPLVSESPTSFQIRELPNEQKTLQVDEVELPPIEPEPQDFQAEFLPVKESPAETKQPVPDRAKPSAKPSTRQKEVRKAPQSRAATYSKASVRSRARPVYPDSARRKGIEGTATVRLSLDGSGRVIAASISKSSGNAALDASALRAAKRWKFNPATSGGRPVQSAVVVPISFRLN